MLLGTYYAQNYAGIIGGCLASYIARWLHIGTYIYLAIIATEIKSNIQSAI